MMEGDLRAQCEFDDAGGNRRGGELTVPLSWMIESIGMPSVAPEQRFPRDADPSTWSEWGHNAKWARADGPLVEGGTVDVKAGYGKVYPCRIRSLRPRPIACTRGATAVDDRDPNL